MRIVGEKNYKYRGMAPIERGDELVTRDANGKITRIERVKAKHPADASVPDFIDVEVLERITA